MRIEDCPHTKRVIRVSKGFKPTIIKDLVDKYAVDGVIECSRAKFSTITDNQLASLFYGHGNSPFDYPKIEDKFIVVFPDGVTTMFESEINDGQFRIVKRNAKKCFITRD